jgi:hypothetical protein
MFSATPETLRVDRRIIRTKPDTRARTIAPVRRDLVSSLTSGPGPGSDRSGH